MPVVYAVRDWELHFEKAQTRKCETMRWIPVPNKHDGKSYRRLMRHANGPALYGAWILILEVASKCPLQRGVLADENGPLDADDLEDKTDCAAAVFREAFDVLVSDKIGWLVRSEYQPSQPDYQSATNGSHKSEKTVRINKNDKQNIQDRDDIQDRENKDSSPSEESLRASTSAPSSTSNVTSPADGDVDGQRDVDDQKDLHWLEAGRRAGVASAAVRPKSDKDRSLVLKASWLSVARYSEHWLTNAVEAVVRTKEPVRNRSAYLHHVLATTCPDGEAQFNAALARVRIPSWLESQRDGPERGA